MRYSPSGFLPPNIYCYCRLYCRDSFSIVLHLRTIHRFGVLKSLRGSLILVSREKEWSEARCGEPETLPLDIVRPAADTGSTTSRALFESPRFTEMGTYAKTVFRCETM